MTNDIEFTNASTEHFLLIKDFKLSLQKATFRVDRLEDSMAISAVEAEMEDALLKCVDRVTPVESANISNAIRENIDFENEFVVSLDGDFLITDPDEVIEITRAARSLEEAIDAQFIRIPRSINIQLLSQILATKRTLERSSKASEITLFDDGLGTGKSVSTIVQHFRDAGVKTKRIVVLANPNYFREIDGVPVFTILDIPKGSIWLNERDLYWGLPRSGISLIREGTSVGLGGIPYVSSATFIETRIGIDRHHSAEFLLNSLEINHRFWTAIDFAHARKFPFRDCPRLAVYAQEIGIDVNTPISTYIQRLADEAAKNV